LKCLFNLYIWLVNFIHLKNILKVCNLELNKFLINICVNLTQGSWTSSNSLLNKLLCCWSTNWRISKSFSIQSFLLNWVRVTTKVGLTLLQDCNELPNNFQSRLKVKSSWIILNVKLSWLRSRVKTKSTQAKPWKTIIRTTEDKNNVWRNLKSSKFDWSCSLICFSFLLSPFFLSSIKKEKERKKEIITVEGAWGSNRWGWQKLVGRTCQ